MISSMYDEISFLFNIDDTKMNNGVNDKDETSIYNNELNVRFKSNDQSNKNKIIDILNQSSYNENSDSNPYIKLIEKLSNENKSLKLGYEDFAYLTELGVYPVNRLVILRRFDEGVIVPHNLNEIDISPISIVIGWIKPEDEKMFNIGFSEKWITTTELFWDAIAKAVKNDTGGLLKMAIPIPSWAQGFLFQFLRDAKLTEDFGIDEIPIGDPDVLRESMTRETEQQGLDSSLDFSFKTSYEQKYINNIDPGSSFIDLIDNTLRMGTSDMKYMLGGKFANDMMKTLNSDSSNYAEAMTKSIIELSSKFIGTLKGMYDNKSLDNNITEQFEEFLVQGLNAAIYRYRWPLRGSLGVVTGQHTTPWHITVGHPLNPIISMGNVVVSNGNMDFNNEMGFNDMPTKFNVSFDVKPGRPLGKSDIIKILNNSYGRIYTETGNDIPDKETETINYKGEEYKRIKKKKETTDRQ